MGNHPESEHPVLGIEQAGGNPVGGNPFEEAASNPVLGTLEQNLTADNPDSVVESDIQSLAEDNPVEFVGNHQALVLGNCLSDSLRS